MTEIAAAPADWRQARTTAEAVDLFPPGRAVRHLNPDLSGWVGEVVPLPRAGRHIEGADEHPDVRVRWTFPADADGPPGTFTAWYAASVIEPVPDEGA